MIMPARLTGWEGEGEGDSKERSFDVHLKNLHVDYILPKQPIKVEKIE
jgi:hypothetical protein